MKYYIFRHGQAIPEGEEYGAARVWTAPVLPSAQPTLEKLGSFLATQPVDFFVSSPVLRCQQTAKIVSRITHQNFLSDDRLREFWEEEMSDLVTRVQNFLHELQTNNYSAVWICTHGAVIAVLKHLLVEGTFAAEQILDFPKPGGLFIIEHTHVTTMSFDK